MVNQDISRKLAVILHADVAGSTDLVQRDETLAHKRITDMFQRLSSIIHDFGGTVHEVRGDALVAEFSRASDAVTAALNFQHSHNEYLETLSDEIKPYVRIGLSLGEVVFADKTVTGPGVVLAQRIEQFAQPGSVCVQGAVYEAIPRRLPFDYENLGKQEVKGFDDPVRIYSAGVKDGESIPAPEQKKPLFRTLKPAIAAVVVIAAIALGWFRPWEPQPDPASPDRMALSLPGKPSIAVLAFDNLSNDAKHDYLSDGLSENIIAALSRFPDFFVIARNSTFTYKDKPVKVQTVAEELGVRYVLEGSIQVAGDNLRATAQLIDATTGNHLWAERYDRDLQDIFAVQDEITQTIAATLIENIDLAEYDRLAGPATKNLGAYEYRKRAQKEWLKFTKEGNVLARELSEKAIAIDPNYSEAYVELAWSHINAYRWGWSDSLSREEALSLAFEMANKARELDPTNFKSYWVLGNATLQSGDLNTATALLERAIELNPNSASLLADTIDPLVYTGQAHEAIARMKKAIRLNPNYPDWYLWNLGWAQYFAEQYHDSVTSFQKMNQLPNAVRRTLAPALLRLGRLEEAQDVIAEFLKNKPDYSIEDTKIPPFEHEEYRQRWQDDLRQLGIPEKAP